ncbi:hypothetical protein [Methylobacterium sp. WL8]|uniref:hypothetical protein n=1 Tax=Methylobacterium sp. WL8 TaxID=2603899 RepID=UPI0011C7BC93|nr:hypothetical protein [Methylobacterium sp. WL8]TXN74096.1 hypothetical protein FV234_25500 [Methylobacterium sp. WL8]
MTQRAVMISGLRWIKGEVGCTDLVDEAGTMHGYVMPVRGRGVADYVIRPGRKKGQPHAKFLSITEHPTDETARKHVEAGVARHAAEPHPPARGRGHGDG